MRLTIAIDGMGGDCAPLSVVQGMAKILDRVPSLVFLLFGNEAALRPLLNKYPALAKKTELHHTEEIVTPDMKPTVAVRKLKKSSMRLALEAVKDGKADAVVSAGNTGAYLGLSKLVLKALPGITRPAIVSQVPHVGGESVLLDLGANVDCSARVLTEFALMGEMFARYVLFKRTPKVGLLNIGSEALKGPLILQKAADALRRLPLSFHGFVEGNDITQGTVDVVVTDGFSGNIALKTGEGVMKFIFESFKRAFKSSWRGRIAYLIARPILQMLKLQLDPRRYNGAFWLGLEGVAVKSHGGADALGFSYAIGMAIDIVKADLNTKIRTELEAESVQDTLKNIGKSIAV